jgi:hypothetical protein
MTTLTAQLPVEGKNHPKEYPPLVKVTRTHVTTGEAAYYLNRAAQTLRMWACFETGPIRPIRIYGRLGWAVTDIRRVLGLP